MLEVADRWQCGLEEKFPGRVYKTTVVDMNGTSVFITRYFKGLKPPDELMNENTSPQQTAVSIDP